MRSFKIPFNLGYYRGYIFYLVLSVFLLLCISVFFSLSRLEKETNQEIVQLRQNKAKLHRLKQYVINLDRFIKEKNLKRLSREEAYKILTQSVDNLIRKYQARVETNIQQNGQMILVKMKIDSPLDNRIIEFLEEIYYSFSPIFRFENWQISTKNRTVQLSVQLIQPFRED